MRHEAIVIIMAGGSGTRFWPVSRESNPKQFLPLGEGDSSLIQSTVKRNLPLAGSQPIMVVTNKAQEALVRKHVPQAEIVLEPMARNTAAAIGLAALHANRINPKAPMVVLPADHDVRQESVLLDVMRSAVAIAAENDVLVTLGVKPSSPNTAYGYIQQGAAFKSGSHKVSRFYEKPNLERATFYYESPGYFWNSGMFIWRSDVFLRAVEEHMPTLHQGLLRIKEVLGSSSESKVIEEVFEGLESISVDFGILEHAKNCVVLPTPDFGWNDVGSWDAWALNLPQDENGNVVRGNGVLIDSKDCVVHSKDKLIAILGAEGLIVIDAGDAMLICPREHAQEVKRVVQELKHLGKTDLI